MLFDIIKTYRGKETIIFTGDRSKANSRLKMFRDSNGIRSRMTYEMRPSESTEKFKAATNKMNLSGDGNGRHPRVTR